MAGQPKPTFYIAVLLVIAGLVAFAASRMDIFAPKGNEGPQPGQDQDIDPGEMGVEGGEAA